MILTLEVTGPQAAKLGPSRRKVFNASGGTIGRLRDNHWSLPDPYVSNRHAVIHYEAGAFSIEDISMNGVFVNGGASENRLNKGQPHPIKNNDWIFIEPYEIRASIEDVAPSPRSRDYETPWPDPQPMNAPSMESTPLIPANEEVDPLKLLGGVSRPPARRQPGILDRRVPLESEHYQPPRTREPLPPPTPASGGHIPTNYDPFKEELSPTPPAGPSGARHVPPDNEDPWFQPAPPAGPPVLPDPRPGGPPREPAARARPDTPGTDSLADVLRGAGIDPAVLTPELARNFGMILRTVVEGVMDVLQARQRIKSEFRMDVTRYQPADNNPLKFSVNVEDALHNLLVKRNAAYMTPVEAFDDAFDDIRNHQIAMLAGMRVAFASMLAQFDPEKLQEEFDRQIKRGSLISVPARLRYWDLYGARIRDMVNDPDSTFRELFGDEFAAAYEDQLKRLKSGGRDNKP